MTKKIFAILAVLFIAGVGVWYWQKGTEQETIRSKDEKPVVKIGAILPLSAGMPIMGIGGRNGAQMAIDEINSFKNNKFKYELVTEDIGVDIKRAVPIYKKLVFKDEISVLLSFNTQVGYALRSLTAEDKIIHISGAADYEIADGEFNYVNCSDINDAIKNLITHFKKSNYKTVAIASFNHASAQKVIETLETEAEKAGIKVIVKSLVNPEERFLNAEADAIVNANPDVLFLYAFEPITGLYAKTLKQAGYKGPISSTYMLTYSNHPELFNGEIYVDYHPGLEDFRNRYKEIFGIDANAASPVMYDNVKIIWNLYENYDNPKENIREKIRQILDDYRGANGRLNLKYDGLINAPTVMVKMQEGKPVVIND